ncbi:GNAT family N-acetyltransferase [Nocardioides sp. GY 10127]|nr:GNAT family N-acetyltransferase [Nocardioides sp. GY 10127]
MPDFPHFARRGIERGTAYVVTLEAAVVGAALLSSRGQHIRWLAVREDCRRLGVGGLLMAEALKRWAEGDIQVVTFPATVPGAQSAIRFYESWGFVRTGSADPAPDGSARDLYVLRR